MHLLYRIDLPNDDKTRDLIKGILGVLAERFDNEHVTVDRSVYNAARIIKLHGTVATKGDNTPNAPWRLSRIISRPETVSLVSREQMQLMVPVQYSKEPNASRSSNTVFDLTAFLDERLGIPYEVDTINSRDRYRLEYCPFNPDHGKNDAAIFRNPDGTLCFHCFHNECADRTWKDVRELIDGPTQKRAKASRQQGSAAIKTDFSHRNLIEGSNPSLSSLSDSYPSPNPSSTLHLVKGFLIEELGEKKKLAPQSKAAEKISEMIQGKYAFSMDASVWYRFDSAHWRMCNCSQVESEITELIYDGAGDLGFSSAYPHGTMDLLRKSKAISLPVQNHRHIPFQNGLLEISTKQLIPIDPQNAMTWILPCDYLKEAQCPNFLQWLAASVENDHGTIRLLQAWINAVLMGRPELQRFLHLVGPAGTGKSTFLRLIFQLVGKDNFTTTSLKQLETNRFEAANIYEKRLVSIEEADKYGGSVSVLKSMTGQDPLRLERKNQQQQGSFIFDGQVLITSNERFATSDNSNGIERRRITVDFTHWITPEERAAWDRRGGEERILWPEIPGIINWSLQLSDAEVRASFQTMPNRIRKANLEAARVNNSVLDWMVNNLLPDETASNQVGDKREIKSYGTTHYENEETRLYPNYLFWTQCNGRKPVSTRSFTDVLLEQSRSYGITCRKVRKKDGTMIEGLKFRQDFEDSWLSRLDGEVKGEGWVKGQVKDKPLIMQEMKDKGTFPTSSYEKNISSIPPTKLDHSYEVF